MWWFVCSICTSDRLYYLLIQRSYSRFCRPRAAHQRFASIHPRSVTDVSRQSLFYWILLLALRPTPKFRRRGTLITGCYFPTDLPPPWLTNGSWPIRNRLFQSVHVCRRWPTWDSSASTQDEPPAVNAHHPVRSRSSNPQVALIGPPLSSTCRSTSPITTVLELVTQCNRLQLIVVGEWSWKEQAKMISLHWSLIPT